LQCEKLSGQFLGLIVMSHGLGEVSIRIWDCFVLFSFYLVSFGESCLLVSWCAGGRCGMACSDEDHIRSRRPGAEDRDGRTGRVLGDRAIERSGGAVCGLHRACGDDEHEFLG
jgi:hypothetical protein